MCAVIAARAQSVEGEPIHLICAEELVLYWGNGNIFGELL